MVSFESQQFQDTSLGFGDLTISSPVMNIVLILIKLASWCYNISLSTVGCSEGARGSLQESRAGDAVEAR